VGDATLTKTTSGWRIELDATGLPRLDDGRFYQAWLKNAAGVLVPIGSFNEGTDVTLWAGVSPHDFNAISVTRERRDGDRPRPARRSSSAPSRAATELRQAALDGAHTCCRAR
jgi:hypothetical protein